MATRMGELRKRKMDLQADTKRGQIISRSPGDIDHYLTQALTNHGCILELAFGNWWRQLIGEIGQSVTPDNIVEYMLKDKFQWQLISSFIIRTMKLKCEEERRRQAETAIS